MNCEQCRQQLLPFLYDLLDVEDRQEAERHLHVCTICQEALQSAREQRSMLAEAVKQSHADITFKAPIASAATVAMPPRPTRRFAWINGWSIAAGLLFAFFSVGGTIGWALVASENRQADAGREKLARAKEDVDKTERELQKKRAQHKKELDAIQKQIDELFNSWKVEELNTRKVLEDKRVQLIIKGPQVALAGAPNTYNIEVRQNADAANFVKPPFPLPNPGKKGVNNAPPTQVSEIQVEATNQRNNEVLFKQNLHLQNNSAQICLPADMAINPGDDIAINFRTQNDQGKWVELRDFLKVVFPEYLTHLTTDRPMYRPGETIRFRSLTLERFSLQPARDKLHLRYRIVGPNGRDIFKLESAAQVLAEGTKKPIAGPDGQPLAGLGAGEFELPADLPGGEYAVIVSEANKRFQDQKRSFLVNRWQQPRFNKEVTFNRSSYGAGDHVNVEAKVAPIQGLAKGFQNNLRLTARAIVDGVHVDVRQKNARFGDQVVNEDGSVEFEFTLPVVITKGVGLLIIECNDGGPVETFQRAIPLVSSELDIEFFPEGGDLIAGVPNRVYFQARTPVGRPADVVGVLRDNLKNVVLPIETMRDDREAGINQGMGSFVFTPKFGQRYTFTVDAPIGVLGTFAMPEVKRDGVVLHVPAGGAGSEVAVALHSTTRPRELLVGAYCRGRLLDYKFVRAVPGETAKATLKPPADVGGVYRITVFEKLPAGKEMAYKAVAERLIYREHPRTVEVQCTPDRPQYQPTNGVSLGLLALDEKKKPVPAVALVAVVDQSVRKLADEKTARAMPTHFLLTNEIRNPEDIENADVLLGSHPKAKAALDLLLGCQGWRRFAEQNPEAFKQKFGARPSPIFVANSMNVDQFLNTEQTQIDKLDQAFVTKAVGLEKTLAVKENIDPVPEAMWAEANQMNNQFETIQSEIGNARHRAAMMRAYLIQFGLGGVMIILLFVCFYLISLGLRRMSESEGNVRTPMLFGIGLLVLLFFTSILGTFTFIGRPMMGLDGIHDRDFRGRNMAKWEQKAMRDEVANEREVAIEMIDPNNLAKLAPLEFDPAPNQIEKRVLGGGEKQAKRRVEGRGQEGQGLRGVQDRQGILGPDAELLRKQGDYHAAMIARLGRRVQLPPATDPSVVREYAHKRPPSKDGVRRDFTETLYWHPVLVMSDGRGQVTFNLNDAVTRFDVIVLTHTLDGRLGASRAEFSSSLPFRVDPRLPIEVNENDSINVQVAVSNDLAKPVNVNLAPTLQNLLRIDNADPSMRLKPNETKRFGMRVKPAIPEGEATLKIVGTTGGYSDGVERKFKIVRDGFPIQGSVGGLLEGVAVKHEIDLPDQWMPGSLKIEATLYPSPLADLQAGLDALLAEPCGCFEQSSSRNYPNVLALSYLKRNSQQNPVVEKRARGLLQSGYSQLTSFECIDSSKAGVKRGYEWFGQTAAPHEALTAYGLLQFRDMAKIAMVDADMLTRTEQYLLGQRDGKGGFRRNPQAIDQFGRAPAHVTDAYILWALTESGVKENLDVELTATSDRAKKSKDAYLIALASLSLGNAKKQKEADPLLALLKAMQQKSGGLDGAEATITGSQGRDRAVETTALTALAWMKANQPAEFGFNVHRAVRWLAGQRQGAGGFGGTQATILALKALVAYSEQHPVVLQQSEVELIANEKAAAAPQDFDDQPPGFNNGVQAQIAPPRQVGARGIVYPRSLEPITLRLKATNTLLPGKNTLTLNTTGRNAVPYMLSWSYRVQKPANDPAASVTVTTSLSKKEAREGDTVKLKANVKNVSGKGQGMAVAIIGLPGGLALPEDFEQLKALTRSEQNGTKPGLISAWELRGRDLVLYWRELAPGADVNIELDLICRHPGVYTGPASRAYLYYVGERRHWTDPLAIAILEKN